MKLTRRNLLMMTGAALVSSGAMAHTQATQTLVGAAFGSTWRLTLPVGADAMAATTPVGGIIEMVNDAMSPYLPGSEISRFNESDSSVSRSLSDPARITIAEALRIAELTDGAFDPTVGALVGRYGFGPIVRPFDGSWRDIILVRNEISKSRGNLTLDLCGIAKGYALDRIVAELQDAGLKQFFIELGGEVLAVGKHPEGRQWQAGIERPTLGASALQRIVSLEGEALATSGDFIQGYTHDGRRYSHIIDPVRRRPVDGNLASVSVFARSAMTADALATALFAMGSDRGVTFAKTSGLSALFLLREGPRLREILTGRFADRILA